MRILVCASVLGLLCVAPARAQSVEGDWEGALEAGPTSLRLVVHVRRDDTGALTATLDSPDQGRRGIPVGSIRLDGSTLTLDVPLISGAFEGVVDADGAAIAGDWTQGGLALPLTLTPVPADAAAARVPAPTDIDGAWVGTLTAGATALPLVLHITGYEDGLSATVDSPSQNALGLPVDPISRDGAMLRFAMPQVAATFRGTIDVEAGRISGTWTQFDNDVPLVLERRPE